MIEDYNYAYLGKNIKYGKDDENVLMKGDDVYAEFHGDTAKITQHLSYKYGLGCLLARRDFFDVPIKDLRPINSKSLHPKHDKHKSHTDHWYFNEVYRICEKHNWEPRCWGSFFEDGINFEVFEITEDGTRIHIAYEHTIGNEKNFNVCKRLYEDLVKITSEEVKIR